VMTSAVATATRDTQARNAALLCDALGTFPPVAKPADYR
jgi:hypothetical protein